MPRWYDIPGYEGSFQITKSGMVRSLPRRVGSRGGSTRPIPGRVLTNFVDDGYWCVSLGDRKNGKGGKRSVHILLARTFIPNPFNKPEVNHIDGIKLNINLDNLEWTTRKENAEHAQKTGLLTGRINRGLKLDPLRVIRIKKRLAKKEDRRSIAKRFGVTHHTIVDIDLGRTWADIC